MPKYGITSPRTTPIRPPPLSCVWKSRSAPLKAFPMRCPLVPENEFLGTAYRHLLFGNYRTIFKIIGARVIILRVIHGARLLDTGLLEG